VRTDFQEKELLLQLGRNERKAAETIYKENFSMVQSLIINNNGSLDDARDVFQEAMLVLFEKSKLGSFQLNCQIKTYLYSVCRRLWLKRLQQYGRYTFQIDDLSEVIPVEEEITQREQLNHDFQQMERAMANLGEPCRSLLEAYYVHGKNMAAIATGFGYTNADNAKNQKYKCLIRLKKLFFSQHKPLVQ
jgi:RNA polymerase sigma factor (sigma-70 family)